jgi:hypothetical protein
MKLSSLIFWIFLPLLISLGHDAYLYYENSDNGVMFSKVGYLFSRYLPDVFDEARNYLSSENWVLLNKYFLDQLTVVVTGVFSVCLLFLVFFIRALISRFGHKNINMRISKSVNKANRLVSGKK